MYASTPHGGEQCALMKFLTFSYAAEDVLATRFPSAIMAAPVSSTDVNSAQASA